MPESPADVAPPGTASEPEAPRHGARHGADLVALGGASAGGTGFAWVYDTETGELLCVWERAKPVHSIALTRDGSQVRASRLHADQSIAC